MGWDDDNPRRTVLQNKLEETLEHAVFLVEKKLESMSGVRERLLTSPLLQRFITGHQDPKALAPPSLSFIVYR